MKMKKCLRALLSLTVVVTGFRLFLNAGGGTQPAPAFKPSFTRVKSFFGSSSSNPYTPPPSEPHNPGYTRGDTGGSSPSLRDRAAGVVVGVQGNVAGMLSEAGKARNAVDKKVESGLGSVSLGAKTARGKIEELQRGTAANSLAGKALGKVKEGLDTVAKKADEKKAAIEKARTGRESLLPVKTSDPSKKESKPGLIDRARKLKEKGKEAIMGSTKDVDSVVEYKPGLKGTVQHQGRKLKEGAIEKANEVRRDAGKKGSEVRGKVEKMPEKALGRISRGLESAKAKIGQLSKKTTNPRLQAFLTKIERGLGSFNFNANLKKESLKRDRADRSIGRYDDRISKIDARITKAKANGDGALLEKLENRRKALDGKRNAAVDRRKLAEQKVEIMGEAQKIVNAANDEIKDARSTKKRQEKAKKEFIDEKKKEGKSAQEISDSQEMKIFEGSFAAQDKRKAEAKAEKMKAKDDALGAINDLRSGERRTKEAKAASEKTVGVQAGGQQTADALTQEGKKGMSGKKKAAIAAGVAAVVGAGLIASQETPEEGGTEGQAPVPAAE